MSRCCIHCFEDSDAKGFIEEHGDIDDCDYCGKEGIKTIDPPALKNLFEPVVALYEEIEEGKHYLSEGGGGYVGQTLGELLDDDWEIFSADLDPEIRDGLMHEIWLGDMRLKHAALELSPASNSWARVEDNFWETSPEDEWSYFSDHLKNERRFIFKEDESGEIVRPERWIGETIEDIGAIRTISPDTILFRGRLGYRDPRPPKGGRNPLSKKAMGAPPQHLARASRANCEGIPMFYAAFEKETAVAESGRFPGAILSVREAKPVKELRLVDLVEFRGVDPLGVEDLATIRRHNCLLNRLNVELSRPIHPDDSLIEYIPTQYLAEAIRSAGYDGICYRSSLFKDGTNVVIFDPAAVEVTSEGFVAEISSVSFEIRINGILVSPIQKPVVE